MQRFFAILSVFLFSLLILPAVLPVLAAEVCPTSSNFGSLCKIAVNGSFIQNVFNVMLVFAVLLSVGFLIYGGIKWITSGGDKAKLDGARTTVIAAIVGLIISFLAFFIISLVSYLFGVQGGTNVILPPLV